ncbi:MAG: hypothetical protein JL50_18180 [Peptococcaceae bacterium BICA1-7]|nr:MAG: hypothetical protein JL50_18180 [Peptococcaceae bacterium BICA1-7]HBV96336.1 diguanylate cyclase response regulator [Desulfotomaculum sp.]
MSILVVDDSKLTCKLIKHILGFEGIEDVITAESASEAFHLLNLNDLQGKALDVDLIILDIIMPDIDGIDACRIIKADGRYREVPIIMLTVLSDKEILRTAFSAGAIDYIVKPPDSIELMARTKSALKLKREIDKRTVREKELLEITQRLEEANKLLRELSSIDGLTGISNRRHFEIELENEWKRAARNYRPISVIMIDIDYFKQYNDVYGHLTGDKCLNQLAKVLQTVIMRPGDILARYGGEEFVAVLTETDINGARVVAERLRENVVSLKIPHGGSKVSNIVTISIGVAATIPDTDVLPQTLVETADKALYWAKRQGRNCVICG